MRGTWKTPATCLVSWKGEKERKRKRSTGYSGCREKIDGRMDERRTDGLGERERGRGFYDAEIMAMRKNKRNGGAEEQRADLLTAFSEEFPPLLYQTNPMVVQNVRIIPKA